MPLDRELFRGCCIRVQLTVRTRSARRVLCKEGPESGVQGGQNSTRGNLFVFLARIISFELVHACVSVSLSVSVSVSVSVSLSLSLSLSLCLCLPVCV